MKFTGEDGIVTYVLCGYNPCANNKVESNTSYQQHRRFYINTQAHDTCPRKRFKSDLVKLLTKWRTEERVRIIVCMDANQNVYTKEIGRVLTDVDSLGMVETVGEYTGKTLGATYFRGTMPIDAVWATGDVEVEGACMMPVGYGVGDHRLFVVDFSTAPSLGRIHPRSSSHRYDCLTPRSTAALLTTLPVSPRMSSATA